MYLVESKKITKIYQTEEVAITAIEDVSFTIDKGSFVSFVGPSGSGKSTLLNMIGCLDPPSSGSLQVVGQDIGKMSRNQAASFRGENIGFVFQDFNLIPVLSVAENVEYPLIMVQNWPAEKRKKRVAEMLEAVDIRDQANKFPGQISGGQKQRVAIARALVTNAPLVLADEPTANLDRKSAERIVDLMKKMRDEFGTTFIFSTHDPRVVQRAETIFTLEDGRLVSLEQGEGGNHA